MITPPPSITVLVSVLRFKVDVTSMVTGAVPQSKVMTPPWVTAVFSDANVQLAAVPVPTTVAGCDVSAGCARAGRAVLHDPWGLPGCIAAPPSAVPPAGTPPSEVLPVEVPPSESELEPPELEASELVEPELVAPPELEVEPEFVAPPELEAELELAPPPEPLPLLLAPVPAPREPPSPEASVEAPPAPPPHPWATPHAIAARDSEARMVDPGMAGPPCQFRLAPRFRDAGARTNPE